MNFVMTGKGDFVEVQGTAEGEPFTQAQLDRLTELATRGHRAADALQREALDGAA